MEVKKNSQTIFLLLQALQSSLNLITFLKRKQMTILQSNNHFHATLGMIESTFPIPKEKKEDLTDHSKSFSFELKVTSNMSGTLKCTVLIVVSFKNFNLGA